MEWSKLQQDFFSHHFENEDSVPPLLDNNDLLYDRDFHNSDEKHIDFKLNTGEKEFSRNWVSSQEIQHKGCSLTLNPSKTFIPLEKRNSNTPYFLKGNIGKPFALRSSKSLQANDEIEGSWKDMSYHKSDSGINTNKSYSTWGQNYYSPFTTIALTCSNTNIDTSVYCTKRQQVVIPMYQPYVMVDIKGNNKIENQILDVQKMLRSLAEEGHLMIETEELLQKLQNNIQLIKKWEKYGVIHTIKRQFGNKEQLYHSLNLDLISHESILWCLRSLKNDEMAPSEKAIQSRLKEVFWYKVTNWLWDHIIDSIKKTTSNYSKSHTYTISNPQSNIVSSQNLGHKKTLDFHSKDEYDILELLDSPIEAKSSRNKQSIRTGGSECWSNYNRKYILARNGKKLYFQFSDIVKEEIKFDLEEDFSTTDSNVSNNNLTNYIIFPAGESWAGVDQLSADIDSDLSCKVCSKYDILSNTNDNDSLVEVTDASKEGRGNQEWTHILLWTKFIDFLKEYFTEDILKFWDKYEQEGGTDDCKFTDKNKIKSNKSRKSIEVIKPSSILGPITSTVDESYRAIPGGRYGWAQFVKSWGPRELRNWTLGKLSQLVQKAINEDILRYQ